MAGSFRNYLHRLKGKQASITFDSSARVGKVSEVGDSHVVLEVAVEGGGIDSLVIPIEYISCAKAIEAKAPQ